MYNLQLDSEAILRRLKESNAYGTLQTDIPPSVMFEWFTVRALGKIQLTFQRGEIIACSLATDGGVISQHKDQILGLLASLGVLRWQLILPTDRASSSLPDTPTPHPSTSPFSMVPYRIRSARLDQFQNIFERKVYQLIDGQRSIERIAVLVRLTKENTMAIIQKLRTEGTIAIVDK